MDHETGSAPPITITDPNRPGELVDVLGSGNERDSWRPGRRTWSLVGVVVLVAAIVVPIDLVRQHDADERARDKAVLAQVRFGVTTDGIQYPPSGDMPAGTVFEGVRNDSAVPLTVTSFHVLAPGYAAQRLNTELGPYQLVTLPIRDTATCSPAVLTVPQTVRVTVRTARHQTVVRDLPLYLDGGAELAQAAQERCRYLKPQGALITSITSTTQHGRVLDVSVNLANAGLLPLRVTAVTSSGIFQLTSTAPFPLDLPSEPRTDHARTGVEVHLRMTLEDCGFALPTSDDGSVFDGFDVAVERPEQDASAQVEGFVVTVEPLAFEDYVAFVKKACR
ncbi:MAG: hypothetical protein JWO12_1242 [Frankiales bacterium]|nr:hypothetical protein [Frankiales bacterium]